MKLTDQIAEVFKSFLEKLLPVTMGSADSKLNEISTQLAALNRHIDDLESKLNENQPNASPNQTDQTMVKTLVMVESWEGGEGEEIVAVVIGLDPVSGRCDADVFQEFCENNLTVKPHVLSYRRTDSLATEGVMTYLLLSWHSSRIVLTEYITYE